MNSEDLIAAIGQIDETLLRDCEELTEERRSGKRKVRIIVYALAAALALSLLTGAAIAAARVWLPASFSNLTEYSAEIYSIEPFLVSIDLPEGCVLSTEFINPENAQSGWSPVELQKDGKAVGVMDYNIFEIYPDAPKIHEEGFYRMVYNQLMLSVQGNWDNNYTVIKQDDISENAVTEIGILDPDVYGSGQNDYEIHYLKGILAFNTELSVYVNIRLEDGAFTDEQIKEMAASIVLSR